MEADDFLSLLYASRYGRGIALRTEMRFESHDASGHENVTETETINPIYTMEGMSVIIIRKTNETI